MLKLHAKHTPYSKPHGAYIDCGQNLRPVFAALYFLQWRLRILCPDADERRTPFLERLNLTDLGQHDPLHVLITGLCTSTPG